MTTSTLPSPDHALPAAALPAPMPYFGGKSRIAPAIWRRLGPVRNYVEPFCGSLAVLLADPYATPTRTVNDLDGLLVNFWRAVQADPAAVARHADWPVSEIDLFSRHVYLVERKDALSQRLMADPEHYDAKLAGWWVWGACAWIGGGWCSGEGPWTVVDGEIVNRKLPHLGNAGQGVNRQLPHLGDAGQGVNRQVPHLGDAGRGVFIRDWFDALAARLRDVRITCGDWRRVVTPSVTTRHGLTAVVLDPPYGEGGMDYAAGGNASGSVAADVWAWATEHGDDPLLRIAVCAYDDGRALPPGWSALRWSGRGYAKTEAARANTRREIVYLSPHCLPAEAPHA